MATMNIQVQCQLVLLWAWIFGDDPRNTVLMVPPSLSLEEKTEEEMSKLANSVEIGSLDTEIMKWEWVVWEERGGEN